MRIALLTVLAIAACATTPTAEENVLAAVEEIRVALVGDDADAVWEHLSTRCRNFWEEARSTRAGIAEASGPDSPRPMDPGQVGVPPEGAARMTAREFHRALYVPAEDLPAVGDGASVRFEDDWARVDDAESRRGWVLRSEDGEWKLEMLVPPDFHGAGLMVRTCPSGREVVQAVMLTWKKVHEVPLPVIFGDAPLEEHGLEVRVALDRDRRNVVKGEPLDDTALKERLLVHADRMRDLDDPLQSSAVHFVLAVHRELTWRRVEEALWLMADPDVGIRNVAFLTSEHPDPRRGVEALLRARARPTQIRYPEPDVEVRIGNATVTAARLAGLSKALAARPDEDFERGIRAIVSPDLAVGPALSVLGVLARRGGPEVVHVLAEEAFSGWTVDGKAILPIEGAEPAPGPRTIPLTLVLH